MSPPICTFYRSVNASVISIDHLNQERIFNIEERRERMEQLHSIINEAVTTNICSERNFNREGSVPNFMEGDFVLAARQNFMAGEKLRLQWRAPRRIVKAPSNYVFQVEDLRNGNLDEIHGSRLKIYHNASLNTDAIISHVISSETGMVVQQLLGLIDSSEGIKVQILWKGLPESEDADEPLQNVYEDVPALMKNLLKHKNTPAGLASKTRRALGL